MADTIVTQSAGPRLPLRRLVQVAAVLIGGILIAQAAAGDGVLVLRNGQVLQGRIAERGDRFVVGLAHGEISVAHNEVELACANLDEAYRLKRAAVTPGSLNEHRRLGEWCLRHGLVRQAIQELKSAELIQPKDPRVELLKRRIEQAIMKPSPPPVAPAPATAEKPAAVPERAASRRLPPEAVAGFTAMIQPMLLNGCSAAACHGNAGASPFRLARAAAGRALTGRLTNRNLRAVRNWIDESSPASSKLLSYAARPHGGTRHVPSRKMRADQYERLVLWVELVTKAEAERPAGAAETAARASRTTPGEPQADPQRGTAENRNGPVPKAVAAAAGSKTAVPAPVPAEPGQSLSDNAAASVPVGAFVLKDPFDPAIFNRRYHARPPAGGNRQAEEHLPRPAGRATR